MGNIKSCNRDQTLQIPTQIPKSRRLEHLPILKPIPICFGYQSEDDEDCKRCYYYQEDKIKEQTQYFLCHWSHWRRFKVGFKTHFYTIQKEFGMKPEVVVVESVFFRQKPAEIARLIYSCRARTLFNKLLQKKSFFEEERNRLKAENAKKEV
jgi:hypothetical protein